MTRRAKHFVRRAYCASNLRQVDLAAQCSLRNNDEKICLRTRDWFPGGEALPRSQAKIEDAPPDAMVP